MKGWWAAAIAALSLFLGGAPRANAQDTTTTAVRLGIVYTPGSRPGIVVLQPSGGLGDSVRTILERDFEYGDRINVIRLDSVAADDGPAPRGQHNYPLYARLGAHVVLQPTLTPTSLHVAVHNVAQKKVERVRDFPIAGDPLSASWRLSLHAAADEVEQWITGVRGISATRVLYVSGGRVWQVDSDGANATPISSAGGLHLSPAWHPRGTHVAYMTVGRMGSQIVIREAGGATRVLPTARSGMNSTPVFSPEGSTLVYAHAEESGTDLYAVNPFGSEPARRVTVGRGSDNTQPSFSPDGRRLAFTTTRLGRPEIYISDADGTNAGALISYNVGDQSYRTSPDWSPDGRMIAFQSQLAGRFQIMTINLRDRSVRQLTSEGINEDPSWAPDSRHIVFTSNRTGVGQLFILDVESGRVRQLTRGSSKARLGAWSPPLRP